MISSMIILDHSVDWKPDGYFKNASKFAESIVTVDLTNNTYKYLTGHVIDDRTLFPATGYLVIVWETFAELNKTPKNKFPVLFQDVHFVRATIMPKSGTVNFLVNIFVGSGKFEVCENGSIVAYGYIKSCEGLDIDRYQINDPEDQLINMELNQNEFYKEFKLRGYQHDDLFKAVLKSDIDGNTAVIEWKDNWVTFIDGLLQFCIMFGNSRNLCLPSSIKKIIIDPIQHSSLAKDEQSI
ncbi:hypothetical protein O3M35_011396 [Rhynocoris fuscipes]|uniref:PKS/mFAS DH domain-containing protein n=1 Tax=Rhynocoris fuscipes TaxID=488301 RepID=A0AAW1D289_9HEMI